MSDMTEIAVRDGKTNFVAILCGIHPYFPITQWDLLIPYAELIIDILRTFEPDNLTSTHTGFFTADCEVSLNKLICVGSIIFAATNCNVIPRSVTRTHSCSTGDW